MTDRPIIFSAPMVRALLAGRKTQTRRIMKPQPVPFEIEEGVECLVYPMQLEGEKVPRIALGDGRSGVITTQKLPYAVGDRLYVREAAVIAPPGWTDSPRNAMGPNRQEVAYMADDKGGYTKEAAKDYGLRIRPSIHMPRWASRLTLTVTDVRVQRLQAISEADAVAEGIVEHEVAEVLAEYTIGPDTDIYFSATEAFCSLWNSLHGAGAWDENPWVVALTFTVERGNIDALGGA